MAKIILNEEEMREKLKEKVTSVHIDFNGGPTRSIVFYDGTHARYFFSNEERVRKAVEKLVTLIEEEGEEF